MPPSTMLPLDAWGAVLTVLLALVQHAVVRRLDLGPAVLAAGAATWLLGPLGQAASAVLIGAAALLALGWWRAAARGVGRPDLVGLVVLIAAGAALAPGALGPWIPGASPEIVRGAQVGPVVLAGLVAALLAFERRGLVGQRVYHWREVPVERVDRGDAGR